MIGSGLHIRDMNFAQSWRFLCKAPTYLPNVLNRYFVSRSYLDKFSNACLPSLSIVILIVSSLGVNLTLKGSGRQFDPLLPVISTQTLFKNQIEILRIGEDVNRHFPALFIPGGLNPIRPH